MNEQQRMHYLDAMGIDMFVPRFVLPAAPAPHQCPLPKARAANNGAEKAEPQDARSVLQALKTEPTGGKSPTGARSEGAVKSQQHTPETGARPPESVAKGLEGLRAELADKPKANFHLQLWRTDKDLLIIDSRQRSQALPTERLLSNILRAFGLLHNRLPAAESLDWPVSDARDKDQSWDAAHEMVQAFLEGRLLAQPVKTLLLFGDDAHRAVLGEQWFAARDGQHRFSTEAVDAFACDAVLFPSLATLLREPERKRGVWQTLCGYLASRRG